jgi:hypothetical protein
MSQHPVLAQFYGFTGTYRPTVLLGPYGAAAPVQELELK